jgi:hypothetical protein
MQRSARFLATRMVREQQQARAVVATENEDTFFEDDEGTISFVATANRGRGRQSVLASERFVEEDEEPDVAVVVSREGQTARAVAADESEVFFAIDRSAPVAPKATVRVSSALDSSTEADIDEGVVIEKVQGHKHARGQNLRRGKQSRRRARAAVATEAARPVASKTAKLKTPSKARLAEAALAVETDEDLPPSEVEVRESQERAAAVAVASETADLMEADRVTFSISNEREVGAILATEHASHLRRSSQTPMMASTSTRMATAGRADEVAPVVDTTRRVATSTSKRNVRAGKVNTDEDIVVPKRTRTRAANRHGVRRIMTKHAEETTEPADFVRTTMKSEGRARAGVAHLAEEHAVEPAAPSSMVPGKTTRSMRAEAAREDAGSAPPAAALAVARPTRRVRALHMDEDADVDPLQPSVDVRKTGHRGRRVAVHHASEGADHYRGPRVGLVQNRVDHANVRVARRAVSRERRHARLAQREDDTTLRIADTLDAEDIALDHSSSRGTRV